MGIISFIILGLIVGALARLLLPGRQPIGILWTIALGMVGALAGRPPGDRGARTSATATSSASARS